MTALLFFLLLVFLLLPGAAFGYALKLRGIALLTATPLLSISLSGLLAIMSGFTPLQYNYMTYPVWSLLGCLVAVFIARKFCPTESLLLVKSTETKRSHTDYESFIGLFIGMLLGFLIFASAFYFSLGNIGLTPTLWDLQFHSNLARWIAETGNASPLAVAGWANNSNLGNTGFYPNGINQFTALLGSSNIMISLNLVETIMVGLFGTGMAVLGYIINKKQIWLPIFTVSISALFLSYSAKLHATGGRWSFGFGFALLPWFVAFLWILARRALAFPNKPELARIALLTLTATFALVIGHPATIYAAGFVLIPAAVAYAWRNREEQNSLIISLLGVCYIIAITLFLAIWGRTHIGAVTYPQLSGFNQSLIEGLSAGEMSHWYPGQEQVGSYWVLSLVIISLMVTLWRGHRWIIFGYAGALLLYITAAYKQLPNGRILPWYGIIHVFYNDRTRSAALLSLVGPLLIAIAISLLIQELTIRLKKRDQLTPRTDSFIRFSALLLVIIISLSTNQFRSNEKYEIVNSAARVPGKNLLEPDEVNLMRQFATQYPDAKIIGHPATGSPLFYAVAGIPSVPRYSSLNVNPNEYQAMLHIADLYQTDGPQKYCKYFQAEKINFFYYDAELYRSGKMGSTKAYAQLVEMAKISKRLEPVMASKTVRIYHLDPCYPDFKPQSAQPANDR